MIQSRASREEVEIKIKKLDELLKIYLKDLWYVKNDTTYENTSFILLEKFVTIIED